ncbi:MULTISPECIES: WG repeat-containing protein [unclassified Carboxylicivirga]|uniref:WG repeat-containing protein n=1 Tax=Carboxylicivirga TaxID=1628153 RepID=UPI003D3273BE
MLQRFIISFITFFIALVLQAQNIAPELAARYDQYREFAPGLYRVQKNGLVGVVEAGGTIIIPVDYNQVWRLNDEGYCRVLKAGKVGVYHLSGRVIIPAEYDQVWPFDQGRAKVMRQGVMGYYNTRGEVLVPCVYQQIWSFDNGRARVQKEGLVGYIDTLGYELIPTVYQQIWHFEDGRARVLKNNKVGFIDEHGGEVIAPVYTHIWSFEEGRAKALLDGQIIWINGNGEQLDLPTPGYDAVSVLRADGEDGLEADQPTEGRTRRLTILGSDIEVTNSEHTSLSVKKRAEERFRSRRFKGHYAGVELGFNTLLNHGGSPALAPPNQYMEVNTGRSTTWALNPLQWSIGLNRKGNFGLITGLGIEWNNYHFAHANTIARESDGSIVEMPITRPLHKNKLVTTHLNMPLLMEYQFPARGHHRALYISAGAIGGLRLGAHTRVVYDDDELPRKQKQKGSYSLQPFRYGAMVRMGYRAINLYSTYYFSTLFKDSKGPELYPVSIGLSVYLDI